MAGLPNRLVAQVAFKAGGDMFYEIMGKRPHHLAKVTPSKIQGCQLHQGEHATNGAILEWQYTLDGKVQTAKQVLQNVDEEKKQISYKMIGGDLLDSYKNMIITVHVETKNGVDFVTWTVDYELLNADNPHPISLLGFIIEYTKDIEAHILG